MLSKAVSRNTLAWRKYNCLPRQQTRHLRLLHELFVTKPFPISAENQAQLNACQPKRLPSPVDIQLDLSNGPNVQPERLTLSETQARLKPLSHLTLSTHLLSLSDPSLTVSHQSVGDKKLYLGKDKTYRILPLTLPKDFVPNILPDKWQHQGKRKPSGKNVKFQKFPHAGRGRQVHFTIYSPPAHLYLTLVMAYGCLLQGCRIEFHLHQKSNDVRVQNTVHWAMEHSLHLRPDVILKAMPEGTELLGLPATSKSRMGEELIWALELPEALSKAGSRTPDHIKKRAMWGHVQTTDKASAGE